MDRLDFDPASPTAADNLQQRRDYVLQMAKMASSPIMHYTIERHNELLADHARLIKAVERTQDEENERAKLLGRD